jgi:peptidoglycan/xylan/chitin deacetylase (PgdA/CDA1 family)
MTGVSAPDSEHFLHERYAGGGERSAALEVYYRVKPLLPRRLQLALRRAYAPRQARREFPAWPVEDLLLRREHAALRRRLDESGAERLPIVGWWPLGHASAAIVTHDVEGPEGVARIPEILEVERRQGVVSSWNFCADWYPIPPGTFEQVREAGCEVGLHGVKHDGRLFSSREAFETELPKIHAAFERFGAVGFRSPATHRNADWMHELGCLYDSSFPDTDPFEPQGGGCCSILPFFFGDVVELPITLVQDHTMWEILRRDDIALWTEKANWVAGSHGLVNVIVHPDYLDTPERMAAYEALLAHLRALPGSWHALPREVAGWWRARRDLDVEAAARDPQARVWQVRAEGDGVAFEIGAPA